MKYRDNNKRDSNKHDLNNQIPTHPLKRVLSIYSCDLLKTLDALNIRHSKNPVGEKLMREKEYHPNHLVSVHPILGLPGARTPNSRTT